MQRIASLVALLLAAVPVTATAHENGGKDQHGCCCKHRSHDGHESATKGDKEKAHPEKGHHGGGGRAAPAPTEKPAPPAGK
ncbi:MAG: hypothetical protein HZB56_00530 [Deltaproteobacteria bacterium]|nr:hypothetical protein [Deltaproteobacteria bacterium]